MASGLEGSTPDDLQSLHDMQDVNCTPVLMDAERVDEERMIIDA